MSPIKYKIAQARVKLGLELADKLLEDADASLPYGRGLTLEQRLHILEAAIQRGTAASGEMRAQHRPSVMRGDRLKTYDEWLSQYDSIRDSGEKTEFYRKHIAEMKAARVKALYPNAVILAPRRRR